ncbi:hypothetical protein B5X24_HaOG205947 [Helicoverpa armigera]|uniref:Uncharacterized protein n=1 Tax=Helicoverpa armigera TaxID=29058 RepID=A0A2W1BL21_HELAM|nr:hypothetical protein B5X24_HaOG205947 [Helicoverpa armigera]
MTPFYRAFCNTKKLRNSSRQDVHPSTHHLPHSARPVMVDVRQVPLQLFKVYMYFPMADKKVKEPWTI